MVGRVGRFQSRSCGANYSAAAMSRGLARSTNDMGIAACGLADRLPLATRNVKDFAYFADHHGLDLTPV